MIFVNGNWSGFFCNYFLVTSGQLKPPFCNCSTTTDFLPIGNQIHLKCQCRHRSVDSEPNFPEDPRADVLLPSPANPFINVVQI